jgi:hypothetical protein
MAAIDYSVKYTIVGPDGTTVSFNDEADGDFMGYIDTITGIDGAEVRENAQNKVADDGGLNGNFYAGRLPFTVSGTIFPTVGSNVKQELLQAAVSKARRADAVMKWTPTGFSDERMVVFRNQQPVRINGKVPKTFQISGVQADYRVVTSAIKSTLGDPGEMGTSPVVTAVGGGNEVANCSFIINGPISDPVITCSDGKTITFIPGLFTLDTPGSYPDGTLIINLDPVNLPDYLGWNVAYGDGSGAHDGYSFIDPLATDWDIGVQPVSQTFTLTGSGTDPSHTSLEVRWRDSWN